jgi:hypothetical protein
MNAFLKKEPVGEPGPALVVGATEEPPIAPAGPILEISGDMGAPVAAQYAVGDEFDSTSRFRVAAVDGDNVKLEIINLQPTMGPSEEQTAEGAIDSFLGGKSAGSADEELA